MDELRGKVAVVTGAASGIGAALARRLADEGMRVVGADLDGADVDVDVSRADEVAALADRVYETHGAVHVLCNNAGVFAGGLLWARPASDFEWTLGVNLWGILNGVRAFVPRMIAGGEEGHVVNTVSMAGLCTNAYSGPYTISKFAAMAATECLAHDLASAGAPIKVSAVVPGLVATQIGKSRRARPAALDAPLSEDAAFVEQVLTDATTGQGMAPDEVAGIVVDAIRNDTFLVPTRASYATQLRDRFDALLERRLPSMPDFD